MEQNLDFERNQYVRIVKISDLITRLSLYKENPNHYYGTVILATAEELKRRLGNK